MLLLSLVKATSLQNSNKKLSFLNYIGLLIFTQNHYTSV